MKYEALKPIGLENIKIKNKSNISEFKYSIEKISYGKYHQSEYIIKTFHKVLNYLTKDNPSFNVNDNNHFYNNRENETYSKFWWNIGF